MLTRHTAEARNTWALDVFSVLLIVVSVVLASLTREDLKFWDESMYLERGLTLGFGSSPGWEWNPLYTDMYWLLIQIFPTPIDAYFAGRIIAALLVVLAVYGAARLFMRAPLALAAALVMASLPVTYIWPGVANPAAACIILAIALVWRWRNWKGWLAATALLWIAAAFRAEFVWAAIVVSFVVGIAVLVSILRGVLKPSVGAFIGVILIGVPLLLSWAYGSPIELGTRSWEAFSQHYEYRFATQEDDPWQIVGAQTERDFPGVSSVASAATANPAAFAAHAGRNLSWFPVTLAGHTLGLGGKNATENIQGLIAGSLWFFSFFIVIVMSRKRIRPFIRETWALATDKTSRLTMLITVIAVGASFISVSVIYPRPHYLVVFVALIVVITDVVIARIGSQNLTRWLPVGVLITASLIWALAHAYSIVTDGLSTPQASALRLIGEQPGSFRLLTPERPIAIYTTNVTHVLEPTYESETFSDFLDENEINVIYDGILFRKAPWSTLPGFADFIEQPSTYGFTQIVPDSSFWFRNTTDR